MRIGIDARLWNETGVGRYIRNLVWNLQEIDKKNSYVLFVKTGFKTSHFAEASMDKEDLGFKNDKWKVVETDIHWHSVKEQLTFPQILYKENLDLMHFPYFSLPIFYTKPFVVTIHDLIINHFPTGKASTLPYPVYRLKRFGYDFVIDHSVRNSRKIIVPLDAVKDDVVKTLNISDEKIVVTYEGSSSLRGKDSSASSGQAAQSPEDRHAPKVARDDSYFLYVGNAYPHKNLERLIEAFVEFKKTTKDDVKLVLVGKDDYFYQRLRDKVEKRKFEGIVFKHNVDDKELSLLYSHAKAFISASLMEGFGLPPLEAMGAGCPVLLSDIPVFREVCRDVAFYFDPLAISAIKEQISFMYNLDHKQKEEHVRKGLERVKQFSWKKMAEETLAVYNNQQIIKSTNKPINK